MQAQASEQPSPSRYDDLPSPGSPKSALIFGLGKGGRRALWMLFLMFSGAYYWGTEFVMLLGWQDERSVSDVVLWAAIMALFSHWWYWSRAQRIEERAVDQASFGEVV